MNKLFSILSVVSILGSSVLATNLANNETANTGAVNKQNIFPFFYKAGGISHSEKIKGTIVGHNGTVYSWSDTTLYKADDSQHFKIIFESNITSVGIKNNTIYVGTTTTLFKSDDGVSFSSVNIFVKTSILQILLAHNGKLLITTNVGLYASNDGVNFSKLSSAIVTKVAVNHTGVIFMIHDNVIEKSIDGQQWEIISLPEQTTLKNITIAPNGDIYLVASSGVNDVIHIMDAAAHITKIAPNLGKINQVSVTLDELIILATENGLYQSFDKANFSLYMPFFNDSIISFIVHHNIKAYIATAKQGMYVINLLKNLLKANEPDYCSSDYENILVYNKPQLINLKSAYIHKAALNGETLVIPTWKLPIRHGKYRLEIIVKKNCKNYLSIFGGNIKVGGITFNFEIKTNINTKIVSYNSSADSTIVERDLISDAGNTKGSEIIQTRDKSYLGEHNSELNVDIDSETSNLIDYQNSYYIAGEINPATNDFISLGIKHVISPHFTIKHDGIYQLHIVDLVGNYYNSYLELGEKNHNKIHGNLTDAEVLALADKLNVTISVCDPTQKTEIFNWLQQYQIVADDAFNSALKEYGKGFDIKINDFVCGYKFFLDPIIYHNLGTIFGINSNHLRIGIDQFADSKINDNFKLYIATKLNIVVKNVIDKKTLDQFNVWFSQYLNYYYDNKNKLLNIASRIATRGFGTNYQINQVKDKLLWTKNFNDKYLNQVMWKSDLSSSDFNFSNLFNFKKLKDSAIKHVNEKFPFLTEMYEQYLSTAINRVDMHGYKIEDVMNCKYLPETKEEIDNYTYNESFSQWLQKLVTKKFHKWQLTIGLSVGLPLVIIFILPIVYAYCSYTAKYNPRDYRIYKRLEKIDQQRYRGKKPKKWWHFKWF